MAKEKIKRIPKRGDWREEEKYDREIKDAINEPIKHTDLESVVGVIEGTDTKRIKHVSDMDWSTIMNHIDDETLHQATDLGTGDDNFIESLTNVGGGAEISKGKIGNNVNLRTILSGNSAKLTVTQNTNDVTLANPVTVSNLGAGSQVLKGFNGSDVEFRSLTQGTNITLTQSATEIEIKATGGIASIANVGTGTGEILIEPVVAGAAQLRRLLNYGGLANSLISGTSGNDVRIKTVAGINRVSITSDAGGGLNFGLTEGFFCKTVILTDSDTSDVSILADSDVTAFGSGKKVYVLYLFGYSNSAWLGGWQYLEDNNGNDYIINTAVPGLNETFFINDIADGNFYNRFRLGLASGGGGEADKGIKARNATAGGVGTGKIWLTVVGLIL